MRAIGFSACLFIAACKAKAGQPCHVEGDCKSGLICWCTQWDAYDCHPGKQTCKTPDDVRTLCASSDNCKSEGECEPPDLSRLESNSVPILCRATAEGCPKWDVCRTYGKCGSARGFCVAVSDADCKRSENCAKRGDCWQDGEWCNAKSDADCLASAECKTGGKCKLDSHGNCDVPQSHDQ